MSEVALVLQSPVWLLDSDPKLLKQLGESPQNILNTTRNLDGTR